MNPEIKDKWVEALRSGRFTQARHTFTIINSGRIQHCCLAVLTGIACDMGAEGIRRPSHYETSGQYEYFTHGKWRIYTGGGLPSAVADWAGLDDTDPVIDGIQATARNDGSDKYENPHIGPQSYEEIADAIEHDKSL